MGSAADALNVFRSFLGTVESPPHSNRTPIGEEYGWNGVAWCDETVSVVLRRIGNPPGPIDASHFASCWYNVQAYKRGECGAWLGNPGYGGVQPGDQGFLGSSGQDHTFMVEMPRPDGCVTLEGNIGDACKRNFRTWGEIYGFGRPGYDGSAAPGLPPPSVTGGRPLLRQGSTGQWVRTLQLVLHNGGWLADDPDGAFGPHTDAAVRTYQLARGLSVDGEVGPETWADIDRVIAYVAALSAPPPTQPNAPPFPGTTKLGSHGDAVVRVQYVLISRGWNLGPGGADGIFGAATDRAVRAYQAEKGLTVDGIVGPQTWVSLVTAPVT